MHQLCYCFYFIIKKWSKLSQKLVFWLILRGFLITPPYTLINYTPIFYQIKHLIVWRGRYIILVNHYCNICGCQVINFQIFSCSMQHPRNVVSFGVFLAVWALSPPNMTLFSWDFDQKQSLIRQGEPSKLIVPRLTSIQGGGGGCHRNFSRRKEVVFC